jgi:hypothetical protein
MTEASVSFAGHLTDNPEVRHTEGGIARAMFRVAVSGRRDLERQRPLDRRGRGRGAGAKPAVGDDDQDQAQPGPLAHPMAIGRAGYTLTSVAVQHQGDPA